MSKSHSMKSLFKLAFLIYLVYSIVSCIKVPQPCAKDHAFELPVTVTPKDTFVVGDTIWWEMDLSNELLDHASGEYVDLTDFELFFSFLITKADSTIPITGNGQTHWFELIVDKGRITYEQNVLSYTYIQTESIQEKRFCIGCVLTRLGTFCATISFPEYYVNKDGDLDDELQIVDPNCEETLTLRSEIIVNNKNNNHYLIDGICNYRSCE